MSWIIDVDSTLTSTKDPIVLPVNENMNDNNSLGGLVGLLAGLGLVSSETANVDDDNEWTIGDNLAELKKKRHSSPIDRCTGVQLHIMLSSPQDLVPGSHESVHCPETNSPLSIPTLDHDWMSKLGERCARSGLGVHVWGINSFEESYCGLQDLLPLVQQTGGQVSSPYIVMCLVNHFDDACLLPYTFSCIEWFLGLIPLRKGYDLEST